MVRAACDGCGKGWDVPTAGKAYRCKECGGRVHAEAEDTAPAAGPAACAACGAAMPDGDRFCQACGAAVDGAEAAVVDPGSVRRDAARTHAARELQGIKQVIGVLRFFYGLGVVRWAFVIWVGVTLSAGLDLGGIGTLLLVFAVGALLINLLGVLRVAREPFLWSVVIAATETLGFALELVGEPSLGRMVVGGFFVLAFWACVQRTARYRTIVRDFPELVAPSRRGRGAGTALPARARNARAHRQREVLTFVGVLVVAIPAAFFLISALGGPPSLEDVAGEFRDDWSRAPRQALEKRLDPEVGASARARLLAELERRGWEASGPALGDPRCDDVVSRYATDQGEMEVRWRQTKTGWVIRSLKFPGVNTGPIRPAVDRFVSGWNAGDLAAMQEAFDEGSKGRRSLPRILDKRGWTDAMPRVEATEIGEETDAGRVYVYLDLADGKGRVRLSWKWHHPRWILSGLKFP